MHKRRLAFGTASFSGMLFWNEASKNSKSISYVNITNSTSHTPEIDILSKYHESNQSHTSSLYSNSGSLYVWVNFWNIDFGWVISVQRSFSTKEPLNIGHLCGKWPIKIKDPMSLRHPVQRNARVIKGSTPTKKSSKCHELKALHEEISQRCVTHWHFCILTSHRVRDV